MNFTQRRATTKSNPPIGNLMEIKRSFLTEVLETVGMNDIPPELILNWNQIGINLVPTTIWTMDKKEKKRIAIEGHQDSKQITTVLCGSLVGELLPLQLIYDGKTKRCHPAYQFPGDWLVSHSHNHWANKNAMIQEGIVPFVENKREALGLNNSQPA